METFNFEDNELYVNLLEPKTFTIDSFKYPYRSQCSLPLIGNSTRSEYILDINKKSLIVSRTTLQNRMKESHTLLRLDLDTKPHRNPDGTVVCGTHIHIFDRTDVNGSWAFELSNPILSTIFPDFDFSKLKKDETDSIEQFRLFCQLCNASNIPTIASALFN